MTLKRSYLTAPIEENSFLATPPPPPTSGKLNTSIQLFPFLPYLCVQCSIAEIEMSQFRKFISAWCIVKSSRDFSTSFSFPYYISWMIKVWWSVKLWGFSTIINSLTLNNPLYITKSSLLTKNNDIYVNLIIYYICNAFF